MTQPTIALFTGDPAGIGPELVQKLLNHSTAQQAAKIILIGQKDSVQAAPNVSWHQSVSYTHLTLPTKRIV